MTFKEYYYNEDVSRARYGTYVKSDGTWKDKKRTKFNTKKFHRKLGVDNERSK
jgi:hypothetical protein